MEKMEEKRRARSSLLISLAIHGLIFVFLGLYVIGNTTKVQELIQAIFVSESKPQKYEPRVQPIRPIARPYPPQSQAVSVDAIPVVATKRTPPVQGRTAKTAALLKAAGEPVTQNVASPSSLARDKIAPRVTTKAKILSAESPMPSMASGEGSGQGGLGDRLGGGQGMGAGGGGRSRVGTAVIRITPDRQPLSITRDYATLKAEDSLAEIAKEVTLGRSRVPPLPKGEPGGIVIGRGKDIEGRIRFARVKHLLADWWSDPTSMAGLTHWMNNQTGISADMNVEGGALKLDDPKLMKCPLAMMTGHDRTVLLGNGVKVKCKHNLGNSERMGLRQYLIEAGGLLFFDECGHDVMLARTMKAELRSAIPEHDIEHIPNDHELYNCYYELGGAPPGAYRFWKHSPRRSQLRMLIGKYLQGMFINDRLAVIISERDYLCAARTKNRPGHGNTGEESPSTYRFLTNLIVYSLTHGGISEYSDYIPEMTDAKVISIDSPVQVPPLLPQ